METHIKELHVRADKQDVRADKHGDEILTIGAEVRHMAKAMDDLVMTTRTLVEQGAAQKSQEKETLKLRDGLHEVRNTLQMMMGEFHVFQKDNNGSIMSHRMDERKREIESLSMRMREAESTAAIVVQNNDILAKTQERLRHIETELPAFKKSSQWVDKAVLYAFGGAVLYMLKTGGAG